MTADIPARLSPPRIQLLLAAALIFAVLLGGTEPGRVATALRAVGAVIGAVVVGIYLARAPRDHDRVDRLVLIGLLVFLLTGVTSAMPRASFEAATTATCYAAAFYLARRAVADERGRRLAIAILGLMGFVIALTFLVLWGSIWLRWISVPGAGLPPFDLALPPAQYRHYYSVSMLAAMLLPATLLLARRPRIWPLGVIGAAAAAMVAFMSGGRTIWLAGVVAVVVALIVAGRLRLPRAGRGVQLGLVLLAGVAAVLFFTQLLGRLATTSTIELRVDIWGSTLSRWLASPIVGFGPGSFAPQLALTGYYNAHVTPIPHAHNAVFQVLLEGGLLGLTGMALVVGALLVGIRQSTTREWAPISAIAFFAVAVLTDNPSIDPYLVAILIAWAALATPMPTSQPSAAAARLRPLVLVAGSVVALASFSTLAASWAHDRALAAAADGADDEVGTNLSLAVALDPSMALYRRELGVWLISEADPSVGADQLRRAGTLNPGDLVTLRGIALASLYADDPAAAVGAAQEARTLGGAQVENALTVAYIRLVRGETAAATEALVEALRIAPSLTASPEWSEWYADAPTVEILDEAARTAAPGSDPDAWLDAMTGAPVLANANPAIRAEAAVIACRPDVAQDALAQLSAAAATRSDSLQARLIHERAFDRESSPDVLTLLSLRRLDVAVMASRQIVGDSPLWDYTHDIQVYGRIPIPPSVGPTFPTPESGMSLWLRTPVEAADVGAPASGLATCR